MRTPPTIKRLKVFAKQIPSHQEVLNTLGRLNAHEGPEFDRAMAIVGATLVENALEIALISSFDNLCDEDRSRMFNVDRNGPLSNFGMRILFAYAMGIIGPKARSDLDRIRHIRNAFAHSPKEMDFNLEEISSICAEFYLLRKKEQAPKSAYMHVVAHISFLLRKQIQDTITIDVGEHKIEIANPNRRYLP